MNSPKLKPRSLLICGILILGIPSFWAQIEDYKAVQNLTAGEGCVKSDQRVAYFIRDQDKTLDMVRWSSVENDGSFGQAQSEILQEGEQIQPGIGMLLGEQYCK